MGGGITEGKKRPRAARKVRAEVGKRVRETRGDNAAFVFVDAETREEREVANKGESRRNKGDQGGSQGKIVGKGKSFNAIKTGKSS